MPEFAVRICPPREYPCGQEPFGSSSTMKPRERVIDDNELPADISGMTFATGTIWQIWEIVHLRW